MSSSSVFDGASFRATVEQSLGISTGSRYHDCGCADDNVDHVIVIHFPGLTQSSLTCSQSTVLQQFTHSYRANTATHHKTHTSCEMLCEFEETVDGRIIPDGGDEDITTTSRSVVEEPSGATISPLLLSDSQLRANNYPNASEISKSYFALAETCNVGRATLVGLDCEMVLSANGKELARVSVVDSHGEVLLDELVKPPRPIVDYCTEFSGITESMLRTVNTTLADIQSRLQSILWKGSVIVGHSLENDLHALRLCHQRVIDTAVLYKSGPPKRRNKPSLLALADRYLDRQVQCGTSHGHDSVEDAITALDLALRRYKCLAQRTSRQQTFEKSFCCRLQRAGKSSMIIGPMKCVGSHVLVKEGTFWVSNENYEIREKLRAAVKSRTLPAFTWLSFGSLTDAELAHGDESLDMHLAGIMKDLSGWPGSHLLCVVGTPTRSSVPAKNRIRRGRGSSHVRQQSDHVEKSGVFYSLKIEGKAQLKDAMKLKNFPFFNTHHHTHHHTHTHHGKEYREEHKEEKREYDKQYRNKHGDLIRERDRQYYKDNNKAIKEYQRRYNAENKEMVNRRSNCINLVSPPLSFKCHRGFLSPQVLSSQVHNVKIKSCNPTLKSDKE